MFKLYTAFTVNHLLLIIILSSSAHPYPRLISHPESAACPCGASMSRPAIPPRCALPLPLPSLFCPLPIPKDAFDLDLLVAKLAHLRIPSNRRVRLHHQSSVCPYQQSPTLRSTSGVHLQSGTIWMRAQTLADGSRGGPPIDLWRFLLSVPC